MERKEISNGTMWLMVSVALLYDVVGGGIQLLPIVGQMVYWIIWIFAFLTFYLWFKIYGRSFLSPKRTLAMGAGAIIEIIPVLSILPGWTVAVIFLIGIEKAERLASHVGIQALEKIAGFPQAGRKTQPTEGRVVGKIEPRTNEDSELQRAA
ncbi:hypothetical protein EPN83_03460 [Patescibacteria group bacterium]|nr:MAG: hypothetical protein EPN83_03460 [Patescibacteria group bacterium]